MKTIHDPRYIEIINQLIQVRKNKTVTQVQLGERLGLDQKYISKVESFVRRLDIIELYDWLEALDMKLEDFWLDIGWTKQ